MTNGVIAGGSQETTNAGAEMLRLGGNAVDAAAAATFAACIAEVGLVHMGGSGIAQVYDASNGRSTVYDFFSNMPGLGATSRPDALNFEQVTIDFGGATQDFFLGRASFAVPGNFFGLCQMAADYGRLPLPTLLQPALRLAREGTPLEPFQAQTCELLSPLYTHTAEMRGIFQQNGRLIQPHETVFIPHLADTLAQLAEEGEGLIRNGRLAQAILRDQRANGGLLTPTDLASYQVIQVPPLRIPYQGYEILLPPPSSTGGVLTAFTLKLMDRFHVSQHRHGSTPHLQILYELMTATSRARPSWDDAIEACGTQAEWETAVSTFLADSHIDQYQAEIEANIRQNRPAPPASEPPGPSNTTHLSVIDSDGLMVSLTHTAGESAGYVVPGTGFIPNNILGEADLHPQGFHVRPAGRRIPTMMTPTVILKDGLPRLVVGSGGSIRIRSAILQTISNLLDFAMPLETAVNTPRVHVDNYGVLQCEAGFDEVAVYQLANLGYPINRWNTRSIYFGGAHSVAREENGRLVGTGDTRRGGVALLV